MLVAARERERERKKERRERGGRERKKERRESAQLPASQSCCRKSTVSM